jgi:hypothetical protein
MFDITLSDALSDARTAAAQQDVSIITFHDDCFIIGPTASALDTYDNVKVAMGDVGLAEQPAKGLVFALQTTQQLQQGAAARGLPVGADGILIAGVPVGRVAFVDAHVNSKADSTIAKLQQLEDASHTLALPKNLPKLQSLMRCIRMCIASTFSHMLRTVDPDVTRSHAQRIDDATILTVMRLLGHGSDAGVMNGTTVAARSARVRLFLPLTHGGYGLTSCAATADAAFIGSWATTGTLVELAIPFSTAALPGEAEQPTAALGHVQPLDGALARLKLDVEALDKPSEVPADALDTIRMKRKGVQRQLSELVAQQKYNTLLASFDATSAAGKIASASLLSASGAHAGAWLQASPAFHSTQLNDGEFVIASNMRLQLPQRLVRVRGGATKCTRCPATHTPEGDHAFCCPHTQGLRTERHTVINKAFYRAALNNQRVSGRLVARMERPVTELFAYKPGRQGEGQRRGDVVISHAPDPLNRKVLDWMITHPTPNTAGHDADAHERGSAAKRGAAGKTTSYTRDFHMSSADIIPLLMETYGCMGVALQRLIKDVADIAVPVAWVVDPVTGKERPVDYDAVRAMHIRGIRECVSVELQRANAAVVRTWAWGCYAPEAALAEADVAAGA